MVILRSQNKITDFLMILAWASPFNDVLLESAMVSDPSAMRRRVMVMS